MIWETFIFISQQGEKIITTTCLFCNVAQLLLNAVVRSVNIMLLEEKISLIVLKRSATLHSLCCEHIERRLCNRVRLFTATFLHQCCYIFYGKRNILFSPMVIEFLRYILFHSTHYWRRRRRSRQVQHRMFYIKKK